MNRFVEMCDERLNNRKPIQYLVGEWDFHRISLLVKAPTLIPRPETEVLVDLVLNQIQKSCNTNKTVSFIDVGCGSGAITLALLYAMTQLKNILINHIVAIDPCPHAVTLTRENLRYLQAAQRLSPEIDAHISIMQSSIRDYYCNENKFDFIVSNPPYIPTKDIAHLDPDVKLHESHQALDGGVDGLDVVCDILEVAPSLVKPGGFVLLEVDTSHPLLLQRRVFDGLRYIDCFEDWYGQQRFVQWQVI